MRLKGTGYYKGQSDPNISIGFPQDFREILKERFLDLAICRFLQINRQVDIVSFMAFIKGTEKARRSIAGKISIYKQADVIDGEVKGKDESGYPYKLWKIINPDKIKPILKKKHISPLQQDTLEILRHSQNGA